MIVRDISTEKALYKLRQQFTKCILLGCVHPIFCYKYSATSEEKLQELLTFSKIFRFPKKSDEEGIIYVKRKWHS